MEEVVVNGVKYVPERSVSPANGVKIGLGITTHNRPEVFTDTYKKWLEKSAGITIVVVDDGSNVPVPEATYRFETAQGIARAKNKCIELLEQASVTEFFLADDDCYPLVDEWWSAYINHPEPHLMALFEDLKGNQKLRDVKKIFEDTQTVAYTGARGYFLYFNHTVLKTVGGMDPIYGKWGFEHVDFSNRIFNAGLTNFHYADVPNSENIIYSMDQYVQVNRSTSLQERNQSVHKNMDICHTRRKEGYTAYVEYREQHNVVITCLYGQENDPQRPNNRMTLNDTETLLNSVTGATTVLYTDLEETHNLPSTTEVVHNNKFLNVFYQRHLNALQYLKNHPEIKYAWCVDATDVKMLQEPWEHMKPGVLYVGFEPAVLKNEWLIKNHPTKQVQTFITENPQLQLLNAGVFGGDRQTMITFLQNLINYWFNREINVYRGEEHGTELGDMGGFNYTAYTKHAQQLQWGTQITTLFKHEETQGTPAWWKHK